MEEIINAAFRNKFSEIQTLISDNLLIIITVHYEFKPLIDKNGLNE